jgi:quinol monooxygenase YgiN
MSVVVQFTVKVPDVAKFKAAFDEDKPDMEGDGARNPALYEDENEPGVVSMIAEWDSHDAMHASSEKRGEEFQAKAGTEGLDWETRIWHKLS